MVIEVVSVRHGHSDAPWTGKFGNSSLNTMPLAYIPKICINQESGGNSIIFPEIIAAMFIRTNTHIV